MIDTAFTAIVAGMSFGIASSLHCFGMCGGLLSLIHQKEGNERDQVNHRLLYLVFRWLSYTTLGALAGLLGGHFTSFFKDSKIFQAWIAYALIIGILFLAIFFTLSQWHVPTNGFFRKINRKVIDFPLHHRAMILGLLNPLLPCGVVLGGIVMSASTGDLWGGALFFGTFALITSPSLFFAGMIFQSLKSKLSAKQYWGLQFLFLLITASILLYRTQLLLQNQACH